MTNECSCGSSVKVPVRGITLDLELNSIGGVVPELSLDKETVWPLRYMGRQVYAKLVDFGALPNGTVNEVKLVPHGIQNYEWIKLSYDYSTIRIGDNWHGPLFVSRQITDSISSAIVPDNIFVSTGHNWSHATAIMCVLYTKSTDPILS